MRRPVSASFNLLAWPDHLDDPDNPDTIGPGGRAHYYPDCRQITGNDCRAVRVEKSWLDHRPERGLCWTCVSRLVEQAERTPAPGYGW